MNDQHNTSGSSHTSWTYFPESDDKLTYYVMSISASSCDEHISLIVCGEEVMPVNPHTTSYLNWHWQLWSECAYILHWCTSCSSPDWYFLMSMTLSYILFFMLERMTCVDTACTLSVAGSTCGAHKQGEWLIIGKTLFSSTHWCFNGLARLPQQKIFKEDQKASRRCTNRVDRSRSIFYHDWPWP